MDRVYSTYRRVWLVELALKPLILANPVLDGPHPLWDLYAASINREVVLAMPGILWDFENGVGLACVKEEVDAIYLREQWAKFVAWLENQHILPGEEKSDLN